MDFIDTAPSKAGVIKMKYFVDEMLGNKDPRRHCDENGRIADLATRQRKS
jgi:hypothetical protein